MKESYCTRSGSKRERLGYSETHESHQIPDQYLPGITWMKKQGKTQKLTLIGIHIFGKLLLLICSADQNLDRWHNGSKVMSTGSLTRFHRRCCIGRRRLWYYVVHLITGSIEKRYSSIVTWFRWPQNESGRLCQSETAEWRMNLHV